MLEKIKIALIAVGYLAGCLAQSTLAAGLEKDAGETVAMVGQQAPNKTVEPKAKKIASETVGESLSLWKHGYLDIHHINTGRGDSTFIVFPDSTTLLFDAGSLDVGRSKNYKPLKLVDARPNNSKRPGQWIAKYIERVMPVHRNVEIDYAVVSHFHSDHFGALDAGAPMHKSGKFRLSGITEIASLIPTRKLIDRGYPDYNQPVELRQYPHWDAASFGNYLDFVTAQASLGESRVEALVPGDDSQIALRFLPQLFPSFAVRNIKSGEKIWSGKDSQAYNYFQPEETVDVNGRYNENVYSLALKISYGEFDYFTGGDMTGLQGFGLPYWFDVETPVAKVVGPVDVLTLNHHGNRDATNANFLAGLQPRVIVQQSWISDHPGSEVVHRMASRQLYPGERDIFATNMLDETKVAIGPWLTNAYRSYQGHIVVRVLPGGSSYRVVVLDDSQASPVVSKVFGPYPSR